MFPVHGMLLGCATYLTTVEQMQEILKAWLNGIDVLQWCGWQLRYWGVSGLGVLGPHVSKKTCRG